MAIPPIEHPYATQAILQSNSLTLRPMRFFKAAVTEKTIGNIIIAVAVLDIHMDADANIKPHNILKGQPR
jgi:hypothetical protein